MKYLTSKFIDVIITTGEFIAAHWVELLILVGLAIFLCYMIRRRSKTLSVLVEKKFGEYKGRLRYPLSLPEQLSSCQFVILFFVLPLACMFVVGRMFGGSNNDPQEIANFSRTLHTCGAIVASFTVMLITIIVFTVTINSAYLVRVGSLFKFYLRRLYFWPVLAFAAGTAGACLINSILINYFVSWSLVSVTVLVCMGYLVIILDLLLLYNAVQALVRSTISEFLGESYVVAHRASLLAHVKRKLAQNIFAESVERLGFIWNLFGLYSSSKHATYTVKSRGLFVNDVYFGPLERLAKKWNLQTITRDKRQRRTISNDNPPNIKIWPGREFDEKEDRTVAMCLKDKEWEGETQKIFDKAFDCGKKERWKVPSVEWSEISDLLKTLIEQKDTAGVKNVFEAFRLIVVDYLKSRRQIDWPHRNHTLDDEMMSSYRAPTLRNLDFYNFIRFAIRSEDEECLDEIGRFLYGMAYTAFESESAEYFDEVLIRLNWLYDFSRGSERLSKGMAATVVRRYTNIAHIFDSYVCKDEDNPQSYSHIFPFVERYLKNVLNAMRQAAKHGDSHIFQELLKTANSILKNYIPDDIRDQYYYNYEQKAPELLEIQLKIRDIKLLSNLVIFAWLYRGVSENEYNIEMVKLLINESIGNILEFYTLIEIYLLAKKVCHHDSGLQYGWWDTVSGVVYSGDAFSRWIEPFWIVIALRRSVSKPKIDLKKIRLLTQVSDFDYQPLSSQIDSILENEDYKWLTGEENLREGKGYLLGVFGALAHRQRKIDYEKIITDIIDEHTVDTFKGKVVEAFENKTKLRNLLAVYQCSEQENTERSAMALSECRRFIDKEDLTGEWRDRGLARICGEDIGINETIYYAGAMEDNLVEKEAIRNFGDLTERIKNEAARLRQKGLNPQTVLIPWDYRYEQSLTDVRRWERKCPIEGPPLPRWVSSIDGMEVFVWPHKDSECVAVVDIGAFARFKGVGDESEGPLSIYIRNLTRDELRQFLVGEAKHSERKEFKRWMRVFEYNMDKVSEMKRIVAIKDKNRLEILDCAAGVKFLPVEKTMGLVYKQDETVYHLPECKAVQEIPPNERRYFCNLGIAKLEEGFQPCDTCHPNRER